MRARTVIPQVKGEVLIEYIDDVTKEVLSSSKVGMLVKMNKKFQPNTSTLDSRKALADLVIPNNDQFKITRVEWGWGSNVTDRSNTGLSGRFAVPVYTAIDQYDKPTTEGNVVKIVSTLSSDDLSYPPGVTKPYPLVREMVLKTNPTSEYPDGLTFSRWVAGVDHPKTLGVSIRLTWLLIFV